MKIRLDLHLHTDSSHDCRINPSKLVRIAKKRKLDGIAITDHDSFRGVSKTIKDSKDILIIPGMEIKTEIGDVLCLFLKEEIVSKKFKEVVKQTRKQKGIIVIPHPSAGHILTDEVLKNADAIEVFNSRLSESANKFAEDLALKLKKPGVANSDAHTYWEIGCSQTIVEVNSKSLEEIKKAILNNKIQIVKKRLPRWKRILIKISKYLNEHGP